MHSTSRILTSFLLITVLQAFVFIALAQPKAIQYAVYSGIPWYDQNGKVVTAHGANIVKDNGKFYLFGEAHTDTSNVFVGFNCYSSADLYNWTFESVALPVQSSGKLGPNRVGERVKVMKCPSTGEFIIYMHTDALGYKDPCIGYATSKNITGPYIFQGALLFNGNPIKKWDMGAFQDNDGTGYLLIHGGNIFKLSNDYKSATEQVLKELSSEGESPAVFKKDTLYYYLTSHRTSWEKNDNHYYTASSLKGPWTFRGIFAPKGSLTWNSQTTFVLPITGTKDTTYMFMGDRWSFPKQASAATYVWQPLTITAASLAIPSFKEAWQINTTTGEVTTKCLSELYGKTIISNTDKNRINYTGNWHQTPMLDSLQASTTDTKGASFSITFRGTQIGFYGIMQPNGGYANVVLRNKKGKTLINTVVDFYCSYAVNTLQFLTPILPPNAYTLTITAMGEHASWADKRRNDYGSKGNVIALDKIVMSK